MHSSMLKGLQFSPVKRASVAPSLACWVAMALKVLGHVAQEFLQHARVPKDAKLTRIEWAIVRAALGKPRRMSLAFLRQVP